MVRHHNNQASTQTRSQMLVARLVLVRQVGVFRISVIFLVRVVVGPKEICLNSYSALLVVAALAAEAFQSHPVAQISKLRSQ
jgi:hypothetical protein